MTGPANELLRYALVLLLACILLRLAAALLVDALPVLIPLAVVLFGIGVWRWYSRSRWW